MRKCTAAGWAAVLALTSATSAQGQIAQERDPRRPPPLEATPTCDVWTGTNHGNDPTQEVEVRLCADGLRVTGQSQYSSLNSGWTIRALEGEWSSDHARLTLRETTMLVDRPNPGWRFCLAERYDLRPGPGPGQTLVGGYVSQACDDHGQMTLRLTRTMARPAPSPSPATTPPTPPRPPPAPPPPRSRLRCAVTRVGARPRPETAWGAWVLVVGAGLALGSSRRRGARAERREA